MAIILQQTIPRLLGHHTLTCTSDVQANIRWENSHSCTIHTRGLIRKILSDLTYSNMRKNLMVRFHTTLNVRIQQTLNLEFSTSSSLVWNHKGFDHFRCMHEIFATSERMNSIGIGVEVHIQLDRPLQFSITLR